jgi:5-methylcytosine-specific restriction enzyme B
MTTGYSVKGMDVTFLNDASGDGGWDEFVYWAQRIYAWPEWDAVERASKLKIADGLRQARAAVLCRADNWETQLRHAVGIPNHVTNWHMQTQFITWVDTHRDDVLRALEALWDSDAPVDVRVNTFASVTPSQVVHGRPLPLASFLLMGEDPTVYAVSRPQPYALAYRLTHFLPRHAAHTSGDRYLQRLEFLDTFRTKAALAGCDVRDRLDAQGLVWSITRWDVESVPMSEWPSPDQARLLSWRSTPQDVRCGDYVGDMV